jgi:hypothetical protein
VRAFVEPTIVSGAVLGKDESVVASVQMDACFMPVKLGVSLWFIEPQRLLCIILVRFGALSCTNHVRYVRLIFSSSAEHGSH